jgi:acetyl esterase/lipase
MVAVALENQSIRHITGAWGCDPQHARSSIFGDLGFDVVGDPDNETVTIRTYGPDPDQYAELYRPDGDPLGVAVVLHGGFWRAAYDASLGRPLARDLAGRGWAAYNIEYRRVGKGGGWPTTLQDVADALDLLSDLDLDLDLRRVVAIGHSAGGHLAAWAAGRSILPPSAPGSSPRVAVTGVVAQAGVLDLRTGAARSVGGTAIPDLLGGGPDEVPERYDWADPIVRVPVPVPVVCVHGRVDDSVPFGQSEAYVAAAKEAGGDAELVVSDGDHMSHVDPTSAAWAAVVGVLPRFQEA